MTNLVERPDQNKRNVSPKLVARVQLFYRKLRVALRYLYKFKLDFSTQNYDLLLSGRVLWFWPIFQRGIRGLIIYCQGDTDSKDRLKGLVYKISKSPLNSSCDKYRLNFYSVPGLVLDTLMNTEGAIRKLYFLSLCILFQETRFYLKKSQK